MYWLSSSCVLLVICLAQCRNVASESSRLESLESVQSRIDDYVKQVMAAAGIPGLSLAIVNGDTDQFTNGYGVRKLNTEDNVTDESLFYIASTTKAMTASVLLETMSRNNVDLKTPVKKLLPEFQVADYTRQEQATVGDLLAHRMGTPGEFFYNWMFGAVTTSRLDLVKRGLYYKPTSLFRDSFNYSNNYYTAAGLVTEALSDGKSWETVMNETLFKPAHMNDTSFLYELSEEQLSRFVTGHEPDWQSKNKMRAMSRDFYKHAYFGAPAGAVVSSAKDLIKWLYVLTHGGLNQAGERVLGEEVIRNTMKPHSIINEGDQKPTSTNYGYGWYIGYEHGSRVASHGGYLFGFHSKATVYPDLKIGIFTCANGQQVGFDPLGDIHDFITRLILNASSAADVAATKPTTKSISEAASNQPILDLVCKGISTRNSIVDSIIGKKESVDPYVGMYYNFIYGSVTVSVDGENGALLGEYGDISLNLTRIQKGKDCFYGIPQPSEVFWLLPPIEMQFGWSKDGATVETVAMPALIEYLYDLYDPPIFTRGLTDSQAPPAPTCECEVKVEEPPSSGVESTKMWSPLLICLAFALLKRSV